MLLHLMAARRIDFNKMPRSSRERFIGCLNGSIGPRPIFSDAGGVGAIVGWILLAICSIGGALFLLTVGFGDSWQVKQGVGWLIPYFLCFFLLMLAVVGFIRRIKMNSALPFKAGTYVFPLDVVVANSKDIEIIPMADLTTLQPVHHYRNGMYTHTAFHFYFAGGRNFSFTSGNKAYAESQLVMLRQSQHQLDDAIARKDVYALAALDPFFELRMNSWAETPQPPDNLFAGDVPAWMAKGWAFGLAFMVLAAPVWFVRNLLSDESAFAKLKDRTEKELAKPPPAAPSSTSTSTYGSYGSSYSSYGTYYYPSIDTYEWDNYIDKGGRHADEVKNVWLAKLALAKAKQEGTPEAIEKFRANYPGSTVDAEAQQAYTDAVHAQYTKAKDAKTVAALRTFITTYPKAADVSQAKKDIHTLFDKTLADFRSKANKKDPTVIPFVESLLKYEEDHNSEAVEVRFRRRSNASLAAADRILAGDGDVAAASSNFDAESMRSREETMVKALQGAFSSVFPADVLALKLGDPLPEKDKTLPESTKPVIYVDYEVGWSGDTYVNKTETRRFVGIKIAFDTVMKTPNFDKSLAFKLNVLPPDRFTVSYDTFSDPLYGSALRDSSGPADTQVYDIMALRAFDQLSTKLSEIFFQVAPKAGSGSTGAGAGTGSTGSGYGGGGSKYDDDPYE
jgi:hypothetical protein